MLNFICAATLLFAVGQCDYVPDAVHHERLLDFLWQQSTVARRHTPPFNATGSVPLNFGLAIISAGDVDTDTGVAELLFWDKYAWTDGRLAWDPDEYGGTTELRIPSTMFWMPDLRTYNSLIPREEDVKSNVYAVVHHDGSLLYIPPNSRKVRCDVSDDKQSASCTVKIGSWTYNAEMIDLNFYEGLEEIDAVSFMAGGATSAVFNNHAVKNVKQYPCCAEAYSDLEFSFDLDLTEDGSVAAAANQEEAGDDGDDEAAP